MSDSTAVTVKLLDRDIQLACPPGEVDGLNAAAKHLDTYLRELRKRSSSSTPEKLALVAAMNMTNELLKASECGPDFNSLSGILNGIESTIEESLRTESTS